MKLYMLLRVIGAFMSLLAVCIADQTSSRTEIGYFGSPVFSAMALTPTTTVTLAPITVTVIVSSHSPTATPTVTALSMSSQPNNKESLTATTSTTTTSAMFINPATPSSNAVRCRSNPLSALVNTAISSYNAIWDQVQQSLNSPAPTNYAPRLFNVQDHSNLGISAIYNCHTVEYKSQAPRSITPPLNVALFKSMSLFKQVNTVTRILIMDPGLLFWCMGTYWYDTLQSPQTYNLALSQYLAAWMGLACTLTLTTFAYVFSLRRFEDNMALRVVYLFVGWWVIILASVVFNGLYDLFYGSTFDLAAVLI